MSETQVRYFITLDQPERTELEWDDWGLTNTEPHWIYYHQVGKDECTDTYIELQFPDELGGCWDNEKLKHNEVLELTETEYNLLLHCMIEGYETRKITDAIVDLATQRKTYPALA